jgi:hypothetical protein
MGNIVEQSCEFGGPYDLDMHIAGFAIRKLCQDRSFQRSLLADRKMDIRPKDIGGARFAGALLDVGDGPEKSGVVAVDGFLGFQSGNNFVPIARTTFSLFVLEDIPSDPEERLILARRLGRTEIADPFGINSAVSDVHVLGERGSRLPRTVRPCACPGKSVAELSEALS